VDIVLCAVIAIVIVFLVLCGHEEDGS